VFYLSRSEQIALFALIALLLGGAGFLTYARGKRAAPAGRDQPIFVPAPAATAEPGEIVVQISGAVTQPGLYRFSQGARVIDAIERAGGAQPAADLSTLNLAARLRDGQHITIPAQAASPAGVGAPTPSPRVTPKRISLNQATQQDLESLPGIGPVYAQHIIAYREQKMRDKGHGFQSVDELLNVPGIGPKRFAAIRDRVLP